MQKDRILVIGLGALTLLATAWLAPGASAQGDPCPNAALRAGASAGLPGCRAAELVSPSEKIGGTGVGRWSSKGPAAHGTVGIAGYDPDTERFAVQGTWGSVLTDADFAFANDWALAERTAEGWRSHTAASRGGYGPQDYRFMNMESANEDLSLMAWRSNGGLLRLFPEQEQWLYRGEAAYVSDWALGRWELFGPTDPTTQLDGQSFKPLATDVSEDGSYAVGGGQIRGLAGDGDPTLQGSSGFVSGSGNVYLFDLSGGLTDAFPGPGDDRRSLVNVCTSGTAVPEVLASGKQGARNCDATLISPRGAQLGGLDEGGAGPGARAVSRDGSRVFLMSPNPGADSFQCSGTGAGTACPAQLYVRQRNTDGSVVTRWISRSRSTAVGGGAYAGDPIADQDATLMREAIFEGASRDGSRVFFKTQSPLTPDDPNGGCGGSPPPCTVGSPSGTSWDLYMYELPAGPDGDLATADADPGEGTLTRVSAGPFGNGDCNAPFGGQGNSARFIADDGGRVYFVCDVPLAGVGGSGNGTITSPAPSPAFVNEFGVVGHTAANLYLYERDRPPPERWRFIAHLPRSASDAQVASCATTATGAGSSLHTAAGLSASIVVNANNCMRGTTDGSFITFWSEGRLTGDDPDTFTADIYAFDATSDTLARVSRPAAGAVGVPYECGTAGGSPVACYADGGIGDDGSRPLPTLGLVSDAGRGIVGGARTVFFESKSRLVQQDRDDAYDVYQWSDGEISLLSAWDGDDHVLFAGNDRAGRNVFVTTRGRLTWEDHDAVLDVYSLRVGGGIPEPPPPAAVCAVLAGACQVGDDAPSVAIAPESQQQRPGNASPDARARLAVKRLGRRARRRAARTGVIRLRVRISRPASVRAVARARIRTEVGRVVARGIAVGRARFREPGAHALEVRVNRVARRLLRRGRRLVVRVRVKMAGARARTVTVPLKRGKRS